MMNENFYLLLTGRVMISTGTFFEGSASLVGPILPFLTIDQVCCVTVHVHPELRVDALASQAAYNEHSVITVT